MNQLIKKLNNFRFTAFLISGIELVFGIATILSLLGYELAGDYVKDEFFQHTAFEAKPLMGMIFFILCVASIITVIVAIYNLFPILLNKEKNNPKKWAIFVTFVNAIIQLGVIVFSVLMIIEGAKTTVLLVISMALSLIAVLGSAFMIIPLLNCEFYMPSISKK